jgi:hypothetical protein
VLAWSLQLVRADQGLSSRPLEDAERYEGRQGHYSGFRGRVKMIFEDMRVEDRR